jgi:hypothetical protein
MCRACQHDMKADGIVCEVRTAQEFPDGTQGPELWVAEEDYNRAMRLLSAFQSER